MNTRGPKQKWHPKFSLNKYMLNSLEVTVLTSYNSCPVINTNKEMTKDIKMVEDGHYMDCE